MQIIKNLSVPTGNILIGQGEHGPIEFLSLGDYGKDVNLNQGKPVQHTKLLPLTEKWVITISSQYGCSMGCQFCDVPKVGPGKNATFKDLLGQIQTAMSLHPEIDHSARLNIHFARMGEPTWNWQVLLTATWLYGNLQQDYRPHPVVSTMMPWHNQQLRSFLQEWMRIKNDIYYGEAGLQLSVNSTSEDERKAIFHGNACSLEEIAAVMDGIHPRGRKITLNFAVADWEIDPTVLLRYFDPRDYIVKLTPMHKTTTAAENGIATAGDYTTPYPYAHHAEALSSAGYDVLVFIASREEDESQITCGNAILADAHLIDAKKERWAPFLGEK